MKDHIDISYTFFTKDRFEYHCNVFFTEYREHLAMEEAARMIWEEWSEQ